jgi:hypothetical protein
MNSARKVKDTEGILSGNWPYATQLSFIYRHFFGIQDFVLGGLKGLDDRYLDSLWARSVGSLSYFTERPTSETTALAILPTSGGIFLASPASLRLEAG